MAIHPGHHFTKCYLHNRTINCNIQNNIMSLVVRVVDDNVIVYSPVCRSHGGGAFHKRLRCLLISFLCASHSFILSDKAQSPASMPHTHNAAMTATTVQSRVARTAGGRSRPWWSGSERGGAHRESTIMS